MFRYMLCLFRTVSFIDLVPYICTCVQVPWPMNKLSILAEHNNREMEEIGIIDAIKDEALLPSHAAKAGGGADASASAEELDTDDLYVR